MTRFPIHPKALYDKGYRRIAFSLIRVRSEVRVFPDPPFPKGGNVVASTGNNGYQKYGFTLSTGLMENGLAATVSFAKISVKKVG